MTESTGSKRAGLALLFAVLVTLVLADWFFGTLTRDLLRGNAQVSVTSVPVGARVLADTLQLGVTPLIDAKVPPGEYTLRVEHPYSQAYRERIVVARGERLQRTVTLVAGVGELALVSNPRGAEITIDGKEYSGVTPVTIEALDAGLHDVRLALPNRRVVKEQVEVLPGETARLSVDLERLPVGELSLATTPADAQVELFAMVDGEQAQTATDYSPGVRLPVGTYRVRVSRAGYEPQQQRFILRRGSIRIAIDLQQIVARLEVQVEPQNARVSVTAAGRTFNYEEPVELPIGQVTLRAKLQGFRSASRRITLDETGAKTSITLAKYNVSVGRVFRDSLKSGGEGPQVVVLGAGAFRMGDLTGEGATEAQPAHSVQLEAPFAIGVFEVSNNEWQQRRGGSGDDKPVVGVKRDEVVEYLRWLSGEAGAIYRLPSEAEWEYAGRGGSTKLYGATDSLQELCRFANVADQALTSVYDQWEVTPCDDGVVRLNVVGSYAANAFGLYDVLGNASEMQADCWHSNYRGAPANGDIWGQKCFEWVARGGAWDSRGETLRISHRERVREQGGELGFRVLREF